MTTMHLRSAVAVAALMMLDACTNSIEEPGLGGFATGGSAGAGTSSGSGGAPLPVGGSAMMGGGDSLQSTTTGGTLAMPGGLGAAGWGASAGANSGGGANLGGQGRDGAAGLSSCPSGQSSCAGACVDLSTSSSNCGACGTACANGGPCQQGTCQCTSGQTACGATCTNLMIDTQNCGSCGVVCQSGQVCSTGLCAVVVNAAADGCAGLAQDLTLSQVAAYQTLKIPLMQNGTEAPTTGRKVDVVAGRDTMFRLFVTVGSGWTPRELSGRLLIDNDGTVDAYFAKLKVSASSTETALDSTFVVNVPKEKITATTRYHAEIVECGVPGGAPSASAAPGTARFPAADEAALGARQTGGVKIKLIPFRANALEPDTSEAALQVYRAYFLAMYPITSIEFTVGAVLNSSDDQDWTGMLDAVRARRASEAPPADVYYYGLLKPAATLSQYCGRGCTAGIGFVPGGSGTQQAAQRAALGLAFADAVSAETMAHEVGHNHGRNHAPCVQGGSISGVDRSYPYSNGSIGVAGWDSRGAKLVATDRTDIMGYCNNKWISDYTYQGILNRVRAVNGATSAFVPSELVRPWRVLLVDATGSRWGIPIDQPAAPAGVAESAEVLDAAGQVLETTTVYRTEISDIGAFSFEVPAPEPGWVGLRVAGAEPILFKR